MVQWFLDAPGRIYVVATLLPLAATTLLLLGGTVRWLATPYRDQSLLASFLWRLCGGPRPLRLGAYIAVAGIGLAAVLAIFGLVEFLKDPAATSAGAGRWADRVEWARVGTLKPEHDPRPALSLYLGYRIDHLTAVLFAMVTVVSTCIFVFSLGYMRDEANPTVTDHEVPVPSGLGPAGQDDHGADLPPAPEDPPTADHHAAALQRRGRFGRFFLYLSLFCFSMLNLLIADNLFQVFVSWELVGVCSFFLIGFYYERPSASAAANKAFIVNRVGDAGFLVGLAIVWATFGTFDFQAIFARLRVPAADANGNVMPEQLAGTIVRGNPEPGRPDRYRIDPAGQDVLLLPARWDREELQTGLVMARQPAPANSDRDFTPLPYWLLVVAGIGIFLGCVGKSAQFPLHTWLPDAMEGPTPVSALIHAATMVAAGVYLAGRVYPFFAPEVLLVIAYTGAVTLFIAATIALVMTDIKRVLAYSTVSQLGYMMLALGVGGWVPALLHLLTHAFFKALLFLCSGSVIFGCHHEQDLRKMGGLRTRMPVTAYTMLVGVLAIVGTPFFSGWYSKDQILGQALGYVSVHGQHLALFLLPLLTAALTAFYMFRLWYMAFAGSPRDPHVADHAHESPPTMTVPLLILAVFSVGVAWGAPPWNPEASAAGELLREAEPAAVSVEFAVEHHQAEERHVLMGVLALAAAALGFLGATWVYAWRRLDPDRLRSAAPGVYRFLAHRWYFDELYDAVIVRPVVRLAFLLGRLDKRTAPPEQAEAADTRFDPRSLDGLLSAVGLLFYAIGQRLRAMQTGLIRRYVLVLVLTVVVIFAILSVLAT